MEIISLIDKNLILLQCNKKKKHWCSWTGVLLTMRRTVWCVCYVFSYLIPNVVVLRSRLCVLRPILFYLIFPVCTCTPTGHNFEGELILWITFSWSKLVKLWKLAKVFSDTTDVALNFVIVSTPVRAVVGVSESQGCKQGVRGEQWWASLTKQHSCLPWPHGVQSGSQLNGGIFVM